jgi:hypothetical protein
VNARAVVAQAKSGARAWRSVIAAQRVATPDHDDVNALADELVDTLRALELVSGVLLRRVHGYDQALRLSDDEGQDPAQRLVAAAAFLADLTSALDRADRAASGFSSQIAHIAVEVLG